MTTNKRSSSNQAKGRHSKYLHRHRWSDIDGQEMKEFRSPLSSTKKSKISAEAQGEDFGYRYAQEQLRYEDILHPDEKSIRQGYDHLCRDSENGDLVVMEYKGQNSDKSKLQKREDWTAVTAEKIIEAKLFPYRNVSEYERQFAEQVREALERGDRVRYEVVRTYVDEKTGDFWTQLEESKLIEKELNADGVGEKINTFDYSHPKQNDSENYDKNDRNERDQLKKPYDNDDRSEEDEPSGEKVNPFESYYPEYFEATNEANEFDELKDSEENGDRSEEDEPSGEKVNPFESHYPEYFEPTHEANEFDELNNDYDEENTENFESKHEKTESDESDQDDD